MKDRLQKRIAQGNTEGGFTLIELLVVIIILGILLAIAVPSYIGFKSKAEATAAQANVRAAVPAVEAFYSDQGTYVGLSNASTNAVPGIAYYDPASSAKITVSASPAPTATSYCIYATNGGSTYFKQGPAGDITKDPGPVLTDCNAAT
jgi:type IV pilus assembly protein PilA